MRVTVAIPLFNEEGGILELVRRLQHVAEECAPNIFRFVFVDDGSSDGTFRVLSSLAEQDARIVVIRLSRNFGHQAALTAALDHADGDVVVLMDGDLQDPPEIIPEFLRRYHEGNDVVYAIREKRKEAFWLRICYHVFYRTLSLLSGQKIPLDSGDFSLLSHRAAQSLQALPETHRFIRGLRAWVGFSQVGVKVERAARYAGRPKYSLKRLLALAGDGIFSFSVVPIRAALLAGSLALILSFMYTFYAVVKQIFTSTSPSGFTSLVVGMVFLAGIQLLFLGIIGEYVGRIYEQVKKRPKYILDCIIKRE